jgi:uncharacterized membrane protein YcaP (DUF421 family)
MAIIASLMSVNLISNLALGFIALGVWAVFTIAIDYLSIKSKSIHDLVNGKETVLMKDGKIMEENLIQVGFTGEELLSGLRSRNAFNLADVEFAVMEPTGEVNVLLKHDKKPATPHDLGQDVAPHSEPQTVILDGNMLDEPLSNLGLNRSWLKSQLDGTGVALENVFLAQVDSSGDLYLDLFDDSLQPPQPKAKEMLYANLRKSHTDLLKYSLETDDKNAKSNFKNDADKLKKALDDLEPHLLR